MKQLSNHHLSIIPIEIEIKVGAELSPVKFYFHSINVVKFKRRSSSEMILCSVNFNKMCTDDACLLSCKL